MYLTQKKKGKNNLMKEFGEEK